MAPRPLPLDSDVIERWAELFARRYNTPSRIDEFTTEITGVVLAAAIPTSSTISSDARLALAFDRSRRAIEALVGRSVLTVSDGVRVAFAREREMKAAEAANVSSHRGGTPWPTSERNAAVA